MESYHEYLKGRGAQINPPNRFLKQARDTSSSEGLDEPLDPDVRTQFFRDHPQKILNKVESPDIPLDYSMNPYQGCEHGCIYCYARNSHEYWGFSAGLDFESKVVVKTEAAQLLEAELYHPAWRPTPIMFSGNTDCYQPAERHFGITRQCLEVFRRFHHPVGLITKNSLILRDLDILRDLAAERLVHVYITITTADEDLRRRMEPRTATAARRFEVVRQLNEAGVPCGVMLGPIIPGLNNHEFPALLERAADAGAPAAHYTLVRLNGAIGPIFENWLHHNYPDRADKVLNQIRGAHGGQLNDSQYGRRMRGEGAIAESIAGMFRIARQRHLAGRAMPAYNLEAFRRPPRGQLSLFDQ
ncbi:MAG: PA0069 family radical SAM protein [Bacteroidia bacterium]